MGKSPAAIAAIPRYSVGETVRYFDREQRGQVGRVFGVTAHWSAGNRDPYISYTLEHPTYRNRRIYTGVERIAGRVRGPSHDH